MREIRNKGKYGNMERLSLDACLEYFYEIDQNQNIEHDALNDAEYCRRICEQGNFVIFIVNFTCNLISLITLKIINVLKKFIEYFSPAISRIFPFYFSGAKELGYGSLR
jgi:hypothetical protein